MSDIGKGELTPFENWDLAERNSLGYTDVELIEALTSQFEKNLLLHRNPEDPTIFSIRKTQLALGVLMALEGVSSATVADFGGGNGYMFNWIKGIIPKKTVSWKVFESEAVASSYQSLKDDRALDFFASSKFAEFASFDLTFFSCTLQYIENWQEVLEEAMGCSRFVLILRTPLIDHPEHQVFVQTPNDGLYGRSGASWPMRFFSKQKFINLVENHSATVSSAVDSEENFFFSGSMIPMSSLFLRSTKVA